MGFYPGKWRVFGAILGVSRWTAKAYLSGARRFTAERARKMLAFLEAEMVERVEVMRLLREEANKPEPPRRKGNAEALRKYEREKRIKRIKERE
jgi:predicted transcriptional regulator